MKKEWTTPSCTVECFEANEYVAVCWAIGCEGGDPEKKHDISNWGGTYAFGSNCTDHSGDCQNALKNRLVDDNSAQFGVTMQENNSEQGWINGYIDSYVDADNSGSITAGDTVYWHTVSKSKDRRWNHCGVAENVSASHPNHS